MIAWISQIALFGVMIIVPLFLQTVRGYGALDTGLILLPQALASGVMMPIGGRLFDKIGARPLAITGLSIITVALFMLSRISMDTTTGFIITCLVMMGAGMGLSMMAINTHVLQAAPRHLVNRVTPLTTAAQQVMVSFAVAGMTGFLTSRITAHMTETANPMEASVAAYGDTFLLAAGIALAGALLGIILSRPKQQPEHAPDDETKDANAVMMAGH
ncbi:MFS transporter [Neobacillus drentensis]|uniref:MFS transporter n=1 Tax=Neobacillus drentensis TaxID=220684 RepID=UPI002FFDFC19